MAQEQASSSRRSSVIHAAVGLPHLDGDRVVSGLTGNVMIDRDDRGMPSITATAFEDAVFAQGFAHAQDRLFQMDLYRRIAAGRIAELIGPAMLGSDITNRVYGFDRVAEQVYANATADQRTMLAQYAAGVNEGMADLTGWPLEYALLSASPEPWRPEDTVLVTLFMFLALADDFGAEAAFSSVMRTIPGEVMSFLAPASERFDAPMVGRGWSRSEAAAIPGEDVANVRAIGEVSPDAAQDLASPTTLTPIEDSLGLVPGSNAWAVAGSFTKTGRAMIANDMHMPLGAPGIWHPVQLQWGDGGWNKAGRPQTLKPTRKSGQAVGLSLPGVPGIVVGSNGAVSFAFTNLIADVRDRALLETSPDRPGEYLGASGWREFESRVERVRVRGDSVREVDVSVTEWGPVFGFDESGRTYALAWTPLDAKRVDLHALDLMFAHDVSEAANIASSSNGPPLNGVFADSAGNIAWAIAGWIPTRKGFDGLVSATWNADVGWDGSISRDVRPGLVKPQSGKVWTSNNRGGDAMTMSPIGRVFASPTRAYRVKQLLDSKDRFDEADFLAMQYDTRAEHFDFYLEQLREAFSGETPSDADVRWALRLALAWTGEASAESPGYRYIRAFQRRLVRELVGAVLTAAGFSGGLSISPPTDEPVRRILEERPDHMLPPGADSWRAYLRGVFTSGVRTTLDTAKNGTRIDEPWGGTNALDMRHPFGVATGSLPITPARLFDMPRLQQAGDIGTVRVARPSFGSSCQFVVQPGAEGDGFLMIPGGVSGHPLSPHYRDRLGAWATGKAEPLLAQERRHRFTLRAE